MPSRRLSPLAFILIIILALGRAASAGDLDRCRISAREFQDHLAELDLAPAQRQAAQEMFAAYSREFDDAALAYINLGDWCSNADGRWSGGEPDAARAELMTLEWIAREHAWDTGWRRLEDGYFAKLRAIAIGDDQRIDSLQRRRLRLRTFRSPGIKEGTPLDLIDLAARMSPPITVSPAVQAELDDYELKLDVLLKAADLWMVNRRSRSHQLSQAVKAATAAGRDPAPEKAALTGYTLEYRRGWQAIENLTETAARRISALLEPADQARFDDAAAAVLYTWLWPDSERRPEQAFADAEKATGLGPDQRARIDLLHANYRLARKAAAERLRIANARANADPDFYIAYRAALESNDEARSKAASDEMTRRSEQWAAAREAWWDACRKTIAEVDAILAEPRPERTP